MPLKQKETKKGILGMTLSWSSEALALDHMGLESYLFVAITPRFTLTQSGCTYLGPIRGSNRYTVASKTKGQNFKT